MLYHFRRFINTTETDTGLQEGNKALKHKRGFPAMMGGAYNVVKTSFVISCGTHLTC